MKLCSLGITIILLLLATLTTNAQVGSVVATVITSNAMPRVGQSLVATARFDVSGVQLGSFGGTLDYDPAALRYVGNSGVPTGWLGVVNATTTPGRIWFNGAQINGVTGRFVPFTVTFAAVKPGAAKLDLSISAMAEARTFADLLPGLVVRNSTLFMRR